ncbi:MAG: VCBS repeat-containing protein [Actinomycetota bacterium]|nr:VCBS repeat-containing protein [Actinomycetota bacterium]
MSFVVAASATIAAAPAVAATPNTPYGTTALLAPPGDQQAGGRWGERTAAPHADYNHDGVPDLFVGDPSETVGSLTAQGRVFLLSGKATGEGRTVVLRTFDSPEPQTQAHFGFFISVIGDVNGDGKPDTAIGTDAQNTTADGTSCTPPAAGCNTRQGKAWVFSGATGQLLYALTDPNPQPQARFGSRIGRAGDVNGDGVRDIIVGASGEDVPTGCSYDPVTGQPLATLPDGCHKGQGQAFIFSGANGHLIRTLNLPDQVPTPSGSPCQSSCGSFGLAVQGPGDVNGDGVPDQLVDAGSYNYSTTSTPPGAPCAAGSPGCNTSQGRMYLFSGKDGSLIRRIDDPEPQAGAFFGFQDVTPRSPGDVGSLLPDGTIGPQDGVPDIYGEGFLQNSPLVGQGKAWVFDGKTGGVLYSLTSPTPQQGAQFGWSMARTNYNFNQFPDLYVGASPHHVPGATGSGESEVFGGHEGRLLKPLELPAQCVQPSTPSNLGPNLGWTVSAPGDLNGDGQPDYVAGAPFEDIGTNQDQGLLFVFVSNPGPHLPPPPCTS